MTGGTGQRAMQLPLGVRLRDAATFAAFEPGLNGAALRWLQARVASGADRGWLWGAQGSGRTHLLEAVCHAAMENGQRAICLSPELVAEDPVAVLQGLEQCRVVALDDCGRLAGKRSVELALFDLCNGLAERGGVLLLAADAAPLSYAWSLADLASRLAAAAVFRLQPLDDAGKIAALQRRARLRGLELPGATARFILSRADRSPEALFGLLDELDLASLSAQRRLTIPFVRDLLHKRSAP